MFEKIKSVVLDLIGKKEFEHDAMGKVVLTADEQEKITNAFGSDFLVKMNEALDKELNDTKAEVAAQAAVKAVRDESERIMREMAATFQKEMKNLNEKVEQVKSENNELKSKVEILSVKPAEDKPAEVIEMKPEFVVSKPWHGVKANRQYFHNQMAFEKMNGNASKAILAGAMGSFSFSPKATGETINTTELESEFGEYMSQFNIQLEIKKLLTQPTESQQFMTTKMAITSWKASKAQITSVVQQFVAKWTPLGSSTFTPIEIVNRRHKINVPITPNDITDGWLTYLYNEQVTPDQMPITRYIIEQLLRPKIADDIELKLIATGEYVEVDPSSVTEGDAGQATGGSMDGYLTILKDKLAGGVSNINFWPNLLTITGDGIIDADNVIDVIDDFTKWLKATAPLYHAKGLDLLIDPVIYELYQYKYREVYPTTKNQDGVRNGPDFSNLTFRPLEAMRDSGIFFCTPKDNFIRLIHQNEAGSATTLFLQVENYDVKVFGEFWLGTGFALEELVFAHVPEESSGSGSGS